MTGDTAELRAPMACPYFEISGYSCHYGTGYTLLSMSSNGQTTASCATLCDANASCDCWSYQQSPSSHAHYQKCVLNQLNGDAHSSHYS